MIPRERIKTIFAHKQPDRIGIFDFFDEITVVNWKKQGLLPDIDPVEYFDFDLDFIPNVEPHRSIPSGSRRTSVKDSSFGRTDKPDKNKFILLCLNGPFQQLVSTKNLQQSLIDFTREPRHTKDFLKSSLNNIFSEYKGQKEEGHRFDGIWLWEDIAYDNGLYFSIEKYRNQLFGFHNEISSYFQNEGLYVVFHCDGNIEQLIPFLVKSKFCGIHPLQESSNPNIIRIKKGLKGAITFLGGIGLKHLKGLHQDILDRIEELKEAGDYIFCFDGPIPQDTEFKTYQNILARIKAVGAYR